jgi:hypothetical protein
VDAARRRMGGEPDHAVSLTEVPDFRSRVILHHCES